MLRIVGLVFACVVVISYTAHVVEASVQFRKCTLYFANENLPDIENGDRFCFQSQRVKICRNTSCPALDCDDPQQPSTFSNCRFCPRHCVHGGEVYTVDQKFKHIDGANNCTCGENNMPDCTKRQTNEEKLCN